MAAVGDNNIIRWYIYTGEVLEVIPDGTTHITVAGDATIVRAGAFQGLRNIVEVICHEGVEKIGECAFCDCVKLRRVVMPGVKIVLESAFDGCRALTDVECGKLEIIGRSAFTDCKSLGSINLPSVRIVESSAFHVCGALEDVIFSNKLERIEGWAFCNCHSLEQMDIPLKDNLITAHDTFMGCNNLHYVDLIEGEVHETIAALQLEEWRNDMNDEIDSINQILPHTPAGYYLVERDYGDAGEKTQGIRRWIRSVLSKIIHYQAEHQRILEEASTTIQLALSQDIVFNNILPLLELPSHTFEVEERRR